LDDRLIEVQDEGHVLETAGIQVSTHLWYLWTEVALDHEWLAMRARRAYEADRRDVAPLEEEMKASLVAVAGVTHCLDALQNEVAALGVLSSSTQERVKSRELKAHTAVYRTLLETFGSPGLGPDVQGGLSELYRLRNEVVHQRPSSGEIVVHPALGMRTTPAAARYTVERATRALDLLFRISSAIGTERDDRPDEAKAWARMWQVSFKELSARRGLEPGWIRFSDPDATGSDHSPA
jgi:hypothetical protein